MRIQLIASDLDGTLLTDKKELTKRTREALEKAIARGVHFVPCTGRSYVAIPEEIKTFPGVEYVICTNGGVIYSVSQNKRIYQRLLEPASVEAALAIPRSEEMVMEAFIDGVPYSEARYVENPGAFGADEARIQYVKKTRQGVEDMERFIRENKTRLDGMLFLSMKPEVRQAFRKELEERVPNIYITSSYPHLLEVGHKDGGKGKTLEYLLKHLQINRENAMAFGDGDNDWEMLLAVDYGIAMKNGTDCCKEAAFYVTETNENEGVAKAMERFME